MEGGAGNDILFGGAGTDYLFGDDGDDWLSGGDGYNLIYGGAGNDFLMAGAGTSLFYGDEGFDAVSYENARGAVTVNLADISLNTGVAAGHYYSSIERFFLSAYDDVFVGTDAADFAQGRGGNDTLVGGGGNDQLLGEAGYDWLDGGAGADFLAGGDGYDVAGYWDATAAVSIDLTKASSSWTGDARGDILNSIEGFDLSMGDDIFRGDDNGNVVNGAAGNDQISGAAGNDYLDGSSGNDILSGGLGGDVLVGRLGADIFQYTAIEESQNIVINGVNQLDQIVDFVQGQDKIDLSAIDANPTRAGDQAFVFIADPTHYTGNWTGTVWQTINPQTGIAIINVSIDGDADAEMQIYMSNPYLFTANDFIL
jgi:serralysin